MVYFPATIYLLPINIHRLNRDDSKNRSDFAVVVVAVAVYLVYYHHRTYRTVCSVRHRDLVVAAAVVDHPVVVGVVVRDVAAGDHHVVVAAAAVVDSHHLVAPRVDTAYLSGFAAGVAVADRVEACHQEEAYHLEEACHQEEIAVLNPVFLLCQRAVEAAVADHYSRTEMEVDGTVAVAARTDAVVVWIAVADSLVVPTSPAGMAAAAASTAKRVAAVARTDHIVAAVMPALLALAAVLRKDPTSTMTPVAGRANTRRDYSDRDLPRHLQRDHPPMISLFPKSLCIWCYKLTYNTAKNIKIKSSNGLAIYINTKKRSYGWNATKKDKQNSNAKTRTRTFGTNCGGGLFTGGPDHFAGFFTKP